MQRTSAFIVLSLRGTAFFFDCCVARYTFCDRRSLFLIFGRAKKHGGNAVMIGNDEDGLCRVIQFLSVVASAVTAPREQWQKGTRLLSFFGCGKGGLALLRRRRPCHCVFRMYAELRGCVQSAMPVLCFFI